MRRYPLPCLGFIALLAGMPAAAQEEYSSEALWGTWADETASSGEYKLVIAHDGKMLEFRSVRRYPEVSEIAAQPGYRRQ